jgi:hypothetical protein
MVSRRRRPIETGMQMSGLVMACIILVGGRSSYSGPYWAQDNFLPRRRGVHSAEGNQGLVPLNNWKKTADAYCTGCGWPV